MVGVVRTVMVVQKFAGAVFLANAIADCWTPCNGGLRVAVGCRRWRRSWGQLQIVGRRVMVGSRWQWVAGCCWEVQLQIARCLLMVGSWPEV